MVHIYTYVFVTYIGAHPDVHDIFLRFYTLSSLSFAYIYVTLSQFMVSTYREVSPLLVVAINVFEF